MTNLERIKTMSEKELEKWFCDTIVNNEDFTRCQEFCPFSKDCEVGFSGFKSWLREEYR